MDNSQDNTHDEKGQSASWLTVLCCAQYGGDEGDRTPDLLHAMQALSQLSYAPVQRTLLLYSKRFRLATLNKENFVTARSHSAFHNRPRIRRL